MGDGRSDKVSRGLAAITAAGDARALRLAELDRRQAGLLEFRCRFCDRVLFKYLPPVGRIIQPCRRCGEWNELTTETSGLSRPGGPGDAHEGVASVRGPEHANGDGR